MTGYCERVLAASAGYVKPVIQETDRRKEPRERTGRKDQSITFRISKKDKEVIEGRARLCRLSVGEYMIRAALEDSVVVVVEGKEILHQLSKLGTNLNQLAILAHQGKITCPNLEATNSTLKKLLRQLTRSLKRGG